VGAVHPGHREAEPEVVIFPTELECRISYVASDFLQPIDPHQRHCVDEMLLGEAGRVPGVRVHQTQVAILSETLDQSVRIAGCGILIERAAELGDPVGKDEVVRVENEAKWRAGSREGQIARPLDTAVQGSRTASRATRSRTQI
jgi:hypothetical protein